MGAKLFLGLMSGTSVDAIDAALLCINGGKVHLEATLSYPISPALKNDIAALCTPSDNEIDRMGVIDRRLGYAFGTAATMLLQQEGLNTSAITAIGCHGQTVRHRPGDRDRAANLPFTLQIGDPNTIAELTGITTVAHFRGRDIAAGGEGAPLVPAFHRACFARSGRRRAVINIGGIANATLLDSERLLGGFDTGPGNTLLDYWCRLAMRGDFDLDGAWAATGQVSEALLQHFLADPFFSRRGPRSTGREYFSPQWLRDRLVPFGDAAAADVQATLAELTATTIARGLRGANFTPEDVLLCGGGAHNADLVRRLQQHLAPATVSSTGEHGIAPDWVEAAAFGWLASQTLQGLAGNAPCVTGAEGERVLGAVYAGAQIT